MNRSHIIVLLLSLFALLLFGMLIFLLLKSGDRPGEETMENLYENRPTDTPREVVAPTTEETFEEEGSLGTDLNMEFPTLSE